MAKSYLGTLEVPSFIVTESKPLDVRTVVDSVDDLTNGSISNLYTGIVVNVKGSSDLYILVASTRQANKIESWAKIGANSLKPEDLAGYAKIEDLADFLSSSDLEDYIKVEDLADYVKEEDLADLASKSDLDGYVKTEDAVDYLTGSDLADYVKAEDLEGYIKAEDLADYVKEEDLADLASKSDLAGYVKAEDLVDYLTSSDLDGYMKLTDLPENVSAFINDAGYLTSVDLPDFLTGSDLDEYVKVEDLENYIPKSELDDLASKSDLEGYVKTEDALDYLTSSDLDAYALAEDIPTEGEFPTDADIEDEEAVADGYATVQDVMDYVNALLEKKKEIEDSIRYAYITGYPLDGTPTNITKFNKYLLNAPGSVEETTTIEIIAPQEMAVWDPSTNDDLPSLKLTVDIPDGYSLYSVYIWSTLSNEYQLLEGANQFGVNPRYTSRDINGITYYSYVRGPVNDLSTRGPQQYKIVIGPAYE